MFPGRQTIKRIPWPRLFAESVLVVLSVLLALAVNSWRQSAANEELARLAVDILEDEIRFNEYGITRALSFHRSVLDTLRTEYPPTDFGWWTAYVKNSAWETARAMGAVPYMDPEIVFTASTIHETQRRYLSTRETIKGLMIRATFGAGGASFPIENMPAGLMEMMGRLTFLEERLVELYAEALAEIKASRTSQRLSPDRASSYDTVSPSGTSGDTSRGVTTGE